jgi:hypothetical protein
MIINDNNVSSYRLYIIKMSRQCHQDLHHGLAAAAAMVGNSFQPCPSIARPRERGQPAGRQPETWRQKSIFEGF